MLQAYKDCKALISRVRTHVKLAKNPFSVRAGTLVSAKTFGVGSRRLMLLAGCLGASAQGIG